MKKDRSKLLAIFLVIVTIAVVVLSFMIKKENFEDSKIKIVTNPSEFFTVNSCIYRVTTYAFKKDTDSLIKVLDENYKKKNNINRENVLDKFLKLDEDSTFVSKKMYYKELNSNVKKYYVYGVIEENKIHDYTEITNSNVEDMYFVVNIDSKQKIFSIEPYSGELFMDGEKNE